MTPFAVFETAAGLPGAAQHFAAARASLRRLAEMFSTPVLVTTPRAPAEVPDGPHTLRLDRVDAAWSPARTVMDGFDLELPPGARVALVGPSGCGKSTIAALLVRFLDPVGGRVTLDGIDLRRIAPERVRQIVGYLPEDAYLFDNTIAANLRVALPEATDDRLRVVLAQARLLDWIDTLPDGIETPIGEHGRELSGGQRRRLALARALLAGLQVLVLDEPPNTSTTRPPSRSWTTCWPPPATAPFWSSPTAPTSVRRWTGSSFSARAACRQPCAPDSSGVSAGR
ncbi:ATP-binding cassette domain-containing protein [Actinoplanes oblitus]|uniref:ATP-binding cassette domain-containing protein n=1 Tax=Actinoplanes oblitus TaxID=3040509 RepID=A0ABY8WUP0_9ACTN|nr:ATP-binding cassette domain-containing protein [Actinoplanes oblitus]WIN00125.1 ATP-binding cassette domain-containing protein [Actinoplanes oblitus]